MNVFVAGATGVLGRASVKELIGRGHGVVGLARSDQNVATLSKLGATPRRADLYDAASLARAMSGCDVVVRTATHISTANRPTKDDWAQNDRVRREGTRALLQAARETGARKYVQESIVWLARPDDGAPFDERSPPAPDDPTRSALDAEQLAADSGIPATTLRFGWFYGDTPHTHAFAQMLRKRRLPVLGDGRARLSFIHVDDAARAVADAVERDAPGVWHAVDDRPTPIGDFLDALAARAGAPRPMRVPVWIGRLAAGAFITRFLTTPMVTSHAPYTDATGWRPKHATVDEGLATLAL